MLQGIELQSGGLELQILVVSLELWLHSEAFMKGNWDWFGLIDDCSNLFFAAWVDLFNGMTVNEADKCEKAEQEHFGLHFLNRVWYSL